MKLNKLTAVLLAFCMLLTCVPAMAATVAIPGGWSTDVIPEGTEFTDLPGIAQFLADAYIQESADSFRLGMVKDWYLTLMGITEAQYQTLITGTTYPSDSNPMKGIYAKGYITYKVNADDAEGTKIYFKDVPIIGVVRNGGGTNVYPGIKKLDIVSHQCTEDYSTMLTAGDAGYVDTDLGHGQMDYTRYLRSDNNSVSEQYTKLTGLYGMPAEPETVETPLPEGTIYISVSDLDNSASQWTSATVDTYPVFTKSQKTTPGPSKSFIAPASGTYVAYGFRKDLSDTSVDRYCRVEINGSPFNFYKTDGAPSTHAWFWDTCGADQTVTLTQGDIMAVSMSNAGSGNFNRITAVALVPVTETDFIASFDFAARTSASNAISAENFAKLSGLNEKVDLTVNTVPATVNGTAVNASKWHDAAATTDIFGDVIDGPSVYDALVAAGLSAKADGTNATSIFVNGKQIYNADKVALNANDVIEVNSGDSLNINNFSAVKASLVRNTEGTTGVASGLKYCFAVSKLNGVGLTFVKKYTAEDEALDSANKANHNNFVGAHLAGYWFNTNDMTILSTDLDENATWQFGDVESVTVPAGTRSYMMNKQFTASIADTSTAPADRISVQVSGATFGNHNRAVFMLDAVNNIVAFKEANDFQNVKTGGTDNMFANSGFNKDNLFITNANADGSIEVVRKGAKFGITTNGVAHLALVRVKADGTKAVEEVTATVLTPAVSTLEEGETIYVWGYNQISGSGMNINTTSGISMVPMCEPIK